MTCTFLRWSENKELRRRVIEPVQTLLQLKESVRVSSDREQRIFARWIQNKLKLDTWANTKLVRNVSQNCIVHL